MRVLVVAAHADDETLGVGGTLLRHKAEGDETYWLLATKVQEKLSAPDDTFHKRRQDEILKATKSYGFSEVFQLPHAPTSLSEAILPNLISEISEIFNRVKPEVIYVVNRSDAHSDHRVLFDAVMACSKTFRYPFIKKVLMYECLSETEFAPPLSERVFLPNYFVNISDYLDKKIEVMKIFGSEMGPMPFPRSELNIRSLAHFRGASSGFIAAESFQLLKYLV